LAPLNKSKSTQNTVGEHGVRLFGNHA